MTWLKLIEALLALTGDAARLAAHSEAPWQSATFDGVRHQVTLHFEGADAAAAGECFLEALPEQEFALAGEVVADARVIWVNRRLSPQPALTCQVELLTLRVDGTLAA